MADGKDDIAKLKQLAENAKDSKLLERIAETNKEKYLFNNKFYSITTEDGIVKNINNIVKNCPNETRDQLYEFLEKYRGKSDKVLDTGDIMAYIDIVSIFLDNDL